MGASALSSHGADMTVASRLSLALLLMIVAANPAAHRLAQPKAMKGPTIIFDCHRNDRLGTIRERCMLWLDNPSPRSCRCRGTG